MDQAVSEIKQMQTYMMDIIGNVKSVEQSMERLRSIEQLLERVAGSNERLEKMFEQSMQAYNQAAARR